MLMLLSSKGIFLHAIILVRPNPKYNFSFVCDASDSATDSTLSHTDALGLERVIACEFLQLKYTER